MRAVYGSTRRMPPPREPPLSVACYYNRVDEVKQLLADGADPLAVAGGRGLTNRSPAIFQCVDREHAECLKALLAVHPDLVDSVETDAPYSLPGATPILQLLFRLASYGGHPSVRPPPPHIPVRHESEPFECVRLLLDAGASLESVEHPKLVSYDGTRNLFMTRLSTLASPEMQTSCACSRTPGACVTRRRRTIASRGPRATPPRSFFACAARSSPAS